MRKPKRYGNVSLEFKEIYARPINLGIISVKMII